MLGEFLEILVDHVQRALKHGVKDFRNIGRRMAFQFVNNRGHRAQHLGLSCRRDGAPLVIVQNGVQQRMKLSRTNSGSLERETQSEMSLMVSFLTSRILFINNCLVTFSPLRAIAPLMFSDITLYTLSMSK